MARGSMTSPGLLVTSMLALLAVFGTVHWLVQSTPQTALELRMQNWNLRFDSKPDSLSISDTVESLNSTIPNDDEIDYYGVSFEVPWSRRRIDIANDVKFNKPQVFTVNEALLRQVRDLDSLLPGYSWVGVGRNDGKLASEFQAVFYDSKRLRVVDWDTFWLSETPFVPSKYPGAGSFRSATRVRLATTDGLKRFTVLNAHLDDQSEQQRQLGASLLRYRGAYELETTGEPVFLLGDFNSQSSGASCGAYRITTGVDDYVEMDGGFVNKFKNSIHANFTFDDIMARTPVENRMGHHATFTSFRALGVTRAFSRIDFQFGGNANGGDKNWEAIRYKVGEIWYDNAYHLSDHRPVVTDISI